MQPRHFLALPATLLLLAGLAGPWVFAADEPAPLLTLKGHRENVFAVAYSPDSKFLVTASGDPSIKVWDATTGKNLKTYGEGGKDAHNKIILALAVSPDGSQFATGSADNSMKLWDMPTSNFLKQIAQASAPRRVAVSPDGKLVAAGAIDGKVRLIDAATAAPAGEFAAGSAAVTALAFSSNGQLLAALSADGALRFFNVAGKAAIGEYAAHPGEGTGLGISPAGNAAFTTGADGSLKYWAFPPVASKTLMTEPVADLGMSTDGASFVLASGKSVRLGALASGTLKSTFAADVDLTAAAASATYVAAATANRDVVLWQTKDAKAVKFAAHAGPVTGVTLNQAGNLLATSGKDGLVRLWALPANAEKKIDGGGPVSAYTALADGKRFVVGGPDKTVRLMKLDGTGAERMLTGHTAAVRGVAVLSDAKTVASAGEEGTIRVWGGKADTVALIGAHAGPVTTLVAVGGRLLSASPDGSVKLWQPVESAGKGTLAHAGAVTAIAISPDGTRLVTGCDDKQVRLWSMSGDKVEKTFTGPTLAVLSVAVSRAGDRVAAGGADKSLFVWESATAKEVRKLTGLSGAVKAVGLPADGKSVVAGLADGAVKLFDLATGKEGKPLTGHKGAVNALILPTRGDTVVTGGEDGAVTVQPLAGGAPVTWKAAGPVADVAVRPDAATIAVGTGKAVQLFTPAGKLESTLTTPANVRGVAYSFDGKRLAVACDDNQARIYGSDGGLEETMPHDAAVNAVAFSTDGRRLVSASSDKTARHRPLSLVWQARPGAVAQAILSPKGDRVLAIGTDGAVHSFNLADGKPLGKFDAHKKGRGVTISGDAARVVTIGDTEARVWDGGKLTKAIALKAEPSELALSPDGKRLAVALPGPKPGTNLVRIYDPATGAELLTLGEAEPLSAVVLTWQSDNRTLTIAGADRAVRLVDVNVVAAFEAHAGGVAGVTFNPAGQLVTAGADKAVRLWSAAGKMEKEFGKLVEAPTAVTTSFDGAMVAATAGKRVVAWTVADGKEAAAFDAPTPLGSLGFNSDRTRLAVATAGRAIVYDLTLKREAQAFLHGGNVTALAWSRAQPAQLFAAGADKKLELHTVGLTRQVVHDKPLRSLAVSGNGSYLVVGGDDGKARRYNAASGAAEKTYEVGDKAVTSVAVTKNEATVAVASADSKLRLFGSGDGKLVATLPQPAAATSLTFTPDSKGLICALSNGVIEGRDVDYTPGAALPEDFGRLLQSYTHGTEGGSVALPSAGNQFWSAGGDKAVKTWKLASESPGRSFPHPNSVNAVAFNHDGTRAITGCSDGKLRVFDVPKAAQLKQIDAHLTKDTTSIYGVAVTRDGKKAATAGQDGAVKVFEVESGKPLREIKAFKDKEAPKGHTDSVLCVAFSPDGNQVVTAGMDQMIKVWNANDGSLVREFANPALKGLSHPGWVYAVRWTSDGKHVISVGQAPKLHGYVAVWEAGTGKLVSGREMDVGTIFSVALSPDEKTMAIGTGGSVRSETHQAIVLRIPGR